MSDGQHKYKVCKVVLPGDLFTYDQRYLAKEEYEELVANVLFVLTFLKRKGKQVEQIASLERTYNKLRELL